jgi:DNA modification methylase
MKRQLINGDCLDELKKLDDNSVDLLCTDPPYGYGFMGKHWDTFKEKDSTKSQQVGWMSPGMKKDTYGMKEFFDPIWTECLRVLKPGALAFVMSAPRSDVQSIMAQTLQEAGFDISFTPIYWTYASGFPKAMNIGKMIDKRGGQDLSWFIDYILEVAKKKNITKKELTMLFPSKNGKPTGWLWNKQKTQGITLEQYNKIKDFLKLPFDTIEEAEREVVGKKSSGLGSGKTYAFTDDNDKSKGEVDITIPKTDKAKELDGAYGGFQPKPAVEVVIVAMKPLDKKGYLEQAQDNQKGVTWFDDCRIPFDEGDTPQGGYGAMDIGIGKPGETQEYRKKKKITMPDLRDVGKKSKEAIGIDKLSYGQVENAERLEYEQNTDGRFPANLLVSDNIIDDGKIRTAKPHGGDGKPLDTQGMGWGFKRMASSISDSGGYSRYFSLDAWFEKNLKSLPEPVQQTFPFMIVPKASRSEKDNGLDRNIHPTVKPLTLMSYLVVLGSRKGDVVLEPFAGSGTTALACVSQERDYIAIEKEEEYYDIAKARLEKVEEPIKLWEKFS